MRIEGRSGEVMDVDSKGRGKINGPIFSEDHDIAKRTGKVWSIPFENIDPTGADDNFIYIKNTGSENNINVTDIRISSTVAGQAKVIAVTGTAAGGTDITPVSRKVGSGVAPTATIQSGSDITGLTDEGILFFLQLDTIDKEEHLRTTSNIIIQPNQAIAIQWEEATGILTGIVSIVEDTP
jgi:hypothetical protein